MNSVTECGERFRWLQGQADEIVIITVGRDMGRSKAANLGFDDAYNGKGASALVFIDFNDVGRGDGGVIFDSVGEIAAHEISGHAYLIVRGIMPKNNVACKKEAVAMQNEYRSIVDHQIAQRAFCTFKSGEAQGMPTFVDGIWIEYSKGYRSIFIPAGLLMGGRK
jgi:D-serine deaminase-like pyridoxal phosphate-dependent protein